MISTPNIGKLCGNVSLAENLDHAQKNTSQESAGNGSDSSEDRCNESLDARHGTRVGCQRRIGGAEKNAGDGGKSGTYGECQRYGAVHIDAHELRGPLILGYREHGLPCLCFADECSEREDDHYAACDRNDRLTGNDQRSAGKLKIRYAYNRRKTLRVRTKDQEDDVLEEVADADGCDKHGQR